MIPASLFGLPVPLETLFSLSDPTSIGCKGAGPRHETTSLFHLQVQRSGNSFEAARLLRLVEDVEEQT